MKDSEKILLLITEIRNDIKGIKMAEQDIRNAIADLKLAVTDATTKIADLANRLKNVDVTEAETKEIASDISDLAVSLRQSIANS